MARILLRGQLYWPSCRRMAEFARRFVSHLPVRAACRQDVATPILADIPPPSEEVTPPVAPKRSYRRSVHGVTWDDPYHWMSDVRDSRLVQHLQCEESYSEAVMADTLHLQALLKKEMAGRMAKQLSSSLVPWGCWYYYTKVPEGQDYPIFCRKRRVGESKKPKSMWRSLVAAAVGFKEEKDEILVDQNLIAEEHGYAQLGMCKLSSDHKLLAYTVDLAGNELFTLFVKDLNSGCLLSDHTTESVVSVEWASDSQTLFYTVPDNLLRPFRVYGRRLDRSEPDYLVFEEKNPSFSVDVGRTKDWCFTTINVRSKTSSEVYLMNVEESQVSLQLVQKRRPDLEYFVEHHSGILYILTNLADNDAVENGSGNLRLVWSPLQNPGSNFWQRVSAAEPDAVIEDMDMFKNHLVLYQRKAGLPKVCVFQMPSELGYKMSELPLPYPSWTLELPQDVCTVTSGGNKDFYASVLQILVSSPTIPEAFLGYDLTTGRAELLEQEEVVLGTSTQMSMKGFYTGSKVERCSDAPYSELDAKNLRNLIDLCNLYACTRREVTSHDGVSVPLTVVHSRKVQPDGRNPALLIGYGAYGESLELGWSSDQLSLLDRGWVLAFAHVRGGGELGRLWYHSGSVKKKKNSFFDFVACAKFLLEHGYVHKDMLCAYGTSAGGLLVAASINQQPELFRAAILKVPFVDICNTMLDSGLPLTVHEYDEWGNPNDPADFAYIRSYSPCDNVAADVPYPAMLVTTSLSDTRVGYWEAVKWVASVRDRAKKHPHRPVILKTIAGGHFGEGGRHQHLRMTALEYAFLIKMARL